MESPRLEGVAADLEASGYKYSWGSGGMLSNTSGSRGELCSLPHYRLYERPRSTPYAVRRGKSRVNCNRVWGCIRNNPMKAPPGVSQIIFSLDLSWSGDTSQKLTPQEQPQRPAEGLISSEHGALTPDMNFDGRLAPSSSPSRTGNSQNVHHLVSYVPPMLTGPV